MKYEERFMSEEARRVYMAGLRRMSASDKLRTIAGLWETARTLAETGVRAQHPDWNESRVREEVRRRMSPWSN